MMPDGQKGSKLLHEIKKRLDIDFFLFVTVYYIHRLFLSCAYTDVKYKPNRAVEKEALNGSFYFIRNIGCT